MITHILKYRFFLLLLCFSGTILIPFNPAFSQSENTQSQTSTQKQKQKQKQNLAKDKNKIKGGDFSLIGKNGWVSLSDFRGKVVALYFGYTQCPDVCPTSLSLLSSAIKQLSTEEKKRFQSIFISVDPGRDTPEILADYVGYFDKDMIGLSAAPDDLDPVVAQYGAFYEKVPLSNSALYYSVDHTSETYIIGKDGKLFATLPHATDSETILKMIREAMAEQVPGSISQ